MNKHLQAAFSLIELLIAMSLSAVLLVVLSSGFYQISYNWESQEQIVEQNIDDAMIFAEIEKAISSAFPYLFLDKKQPIIFFTGDGEEVSFVSTFSPSYNQQTMIWKIKADVTGGLDIFLTPLLTGDPKDSLQQNKQEPTRVLEDYIASIEYLRKDKKQTIWRKRWDASKNNILPLAVKITFKEKQALQDEAKKSLYLIANIAANHHPSAREK